MDQINWSAFLARPRLPSPSAEVFDALYRQPILITGAGGSIGSALALRLAVVTPPALVLLESAEDHLFALKRQWAAAGAACRPIEILGSAADRPLLDHLFTTHRPRIVFHAAAFKHVPLLEEHPLPAIANNIFATETLTSVAAAHGARVILLSTDKAVQPASLMGATKRVAEHIVLAAGGTVLRLGNVLASRDSVAETFARQIAGGEPITITDPGARRYFLTLDEAVNLLLIAAAIPSSRALLAPVLPAPHFVADLARFLARELAADRETEVHFTSLRPGDKVTEQMWSEGDSIQPASPSPSFAGLVSIQSRQIETVQLNAALANLRAALEARDLAGALAGLRGLVPDYTPSAVLRSLAQQPSPQLHQ